ncbi:UDP-N-acetylglucosamine--dolichyl-phosphate N-acetylglucosaminephosphotransferase [Gorgonomyces haynaldii]|nr:UDP-N-acetylglucosamine--dolichyl-phosphate N-acetylglucosaminephosphotransferase [Gorgonomyces haynaldii]
MDQLVEILQSFASPIGISCCLSLVAFYLVQYIIDQVSPHFITKGLTGKDLLKEHQPVIPESMGAIVGVCYFVAMFLFIPVPFMDHPDQFPHDKFAQLLGGMLALFSMLFLGFADDILDIRWRIKLWFPYVASVPLLMVYYVTYGKTDVLVPIPLRPLFPSTIIHLGPLYYLYIGTMVAFSTNAINIMAGVNGVEGGQSLVIALSLAINNLIQLHDVSRHDANMYSLFFLIPFIGVVCGYLLKNWYPAQCFGGDTFTYFAGMIFAVVGVLNNMSKTVMLFMLPQLFNFMYSCPQLFHFVECPRHRMPRLQDGKIHYTTCSLVNTKPVGKAMVRFLELLGLCKIERKEGKMIECNNLTLINLILVYMGPMPERNVALSVVVVQICGSVIGFLIRYGLVHIVYN